MRATTLPVPDYYNRRACEVCARLPVSLSAGVYVSFVAVAVVEEHAFLIAYTLDGQVSCVDQNFTCVVVEAILSVAVLSARMDQMHLRMQPSGAQLGHIPSAPVTEVQRLGKHGSQQQQVAPAPVVNTVLSSSTGGTGIHVDSPSALSGAGSIVANSAAEVAPAAKPGRPAPSTVPHPLDRNPDDPSLKPDETEFIREQIRYEWQGHVVDCEALYHSSTPKRVIDTIGVRHAYYLMHVAESMPSQSWL